MEIQHVQADILGRQFNIGTPASEYESLVQAVQMLNDKINAIQAAGRIVDTDKIVIMAALNLTHDLLKANLDISRIADSYSSRIDELKRSCDEILNLVNS